MRNISFALTSGQIYRQAKTVTRRVGWAWLKPGTLLQPVEKSQGIKKGEKVQRIGAPIRVLSVRRERLDCMSTDPAYGNEECIAEGFPEWVGEPEKFVAMFCQTHVIPDTRIGPPRHKYRQPFPMTPLDEVTRIEFEYTEPAA